MAQAGQHNYPCMWLRGLPPRSWTTPPECDAEFTERLFGEALNLPGVVATNGPLLVCGDGSGGANADDDRYRLCGWAWVALDRSSPFAPALRGGAQGPLAGPKQTNNRAELSALLSAFQHTEGPMDFWTDSEVLYKGWRRGRHTRPGGLSAHGDLWGQMKTALQERGQAEVQVYFMSSHQTALEA
eukprot:8600525-Pyramimonas_sp.AAC.1